MKFDSWIQTRIRNSDQDPYPGPYIFLQIFTPVIFFYIVPDPDPLTLGFQDPAYSSEYYKNKLKYQSDIRTIPSPWSTEAFICIYGNSYQYCGVYKNLLLTLARR
jgi:hypothetical protein